MLVVPKVDTDDVQSLLFTAYAKHEASFHLLWAKDPARARSQLAQKNLRITVGRPDPNRNQPDPDPGVQIAFTAEGLRRLGLDDEVAGGFSHAFRDGMSDGRRRVLGDVGPSDPKEWGWGQPAPHAILLVYASSGAEGVAKEIIERQLTEWRSQRLSPPVSLRAGDRPNLKEHFGFDDGIANPIIRGLGDERHALPHNVVAPGEFILGYLNEARRVPLSPYVAAGGRGGHVLPNGDFGRNGSYLVVRQLEQHVRAFWTFMLERSDGKPEEAIRLASKMIGRWPNGAPMTVWSTHQPADADWRSSRNDAFLYAADPDGYGCPIGAHVRRANPRDCVPQLDPQKSVETSKQRRILRRGRSYGAPLEGVFEGSWPDLERIGAGKESDDGRGLYFMCFVSDLERQFEFVQQTWVNSRKFAGLGNDADPILSNPHIPPDQSPSPSDFVIQRDALNQRISGLGHFVTVRGSAYFFMPSGRALEYLSGL